MAAAVSAVVDSVAAGAVLAGLAVECPVGVEQEEAGRRIVDL